MNERHNQARGASEWADTYGSLGMVSPAQLTQLPLHILDSWTDPDGKKQPFRSYSQEKLEELADNILKNGIIEPICVRPMTNGRFQIIAGHNRVAAAKIAGLATVPALVRQLSDNEAEILMVDSNLQHREKLLPSEKAFAYLERMNAIRKLREQATQGGTIGAPFETDTTGAPLVPQPLKGKSRDIIAEESGENREQIRRYIRLTELLPELLDLVDDEKLAFRAAVEISYLTKEEQQILRMVMDDFKCKAPSMAQAAQIRKLSQENTLDESRILSILKPEKMPKAVTVKLPAERISSFFPQNITPEQMEAEIYEALAFYRQHKTPASA